MPPFTMQHREFVPPAALQDSIRCFWHNRGDFGERPSSFEVLPDGYAEIIFHFGSPCNLVGKGDLQPLPSPFLMGLLDHPVLLSTQGRFEILGIRCFPWTVFDLLGLPPSKDEVRVLEHPIARLQSTLEEWMQAGRIERALAEIELYFLNTRSRMMLDSVLFDAGTALRKANGTLQVNQVASAAHATVRTLERKFKQASGHTVKDVSGLIRFEQARNRLWLSPDSNIAALAYDLGYTDQAHLSREFKRYSGTTPGAFARRAREGDRR